MPYVTATKKMRIFNPLFTGLEYWRNGRLVKARGFTAELVPGDVFYTGEVPMGNPEFMEMVGYGGLGSTKKMFEITEWQNPTFVYFDLVELRGYGVGASSGTRRYPYIAGGMPWGTENFISKWHHNGKYYYNGNEIKRQNIYNSSTMYFAEWTYTREFAYLRNDEMVLGMPNIVIATGIQTNVGGSDWPLTWAHLMAKTEFAGLFFIDKYHSGGGQRYGDKYVIRCPLGANFALNKRFVIKEWATGTEWEEAGRPAWMTTFDSCTGSKPMFTVAVKLPASNDNYVNWGMTASDGDSVNVNLSTSLPRFGNDCAVYRFRFEIPYGIE